ncbi:hypothetical protein E2562_028180 [Oryza meyeriana var. granulata]|uniref:Pentatricopeptide repeat-containing protein n=1 Tax=Oryza meyeriana var. granulata TaxID=110450 RepID=A0A6G1CU01_9ORYZ|nr:hypothetical protein E2562_028180 [Oryza meyeriana var. granulata]
MSLLKPLCHAPSSLSTHIRSLAQILLSCLTNRDHLRRVNPAIHARAVVAGGLDNLFLTNLLLRGYSKLGHLRDAQIGCGEVALELFDRMGIEGVCPDRIRLMLKL